VELMRDEDEGVRLAVVRLVRCCHFVGTLLWLYFLVGLNDLFKIEVLTKLMCSLRWIGRPMFSEGCCEDGCRRQGW
jgi:hypothetical protein